MARNPEELEGLRFQAGPEPTESKSYIPQFPPSTLEDAEAQSLALLSQILEIEAQLGDPYKQAVDGSRLTRDEYFEWRKKANLARAIKITQRAKVRAWIKQQRTKNSKVVYITPELQRFLADIADLIDCLAKDGIEFSEDEAALIDKLEYYAKLGSPSVSQ